MKCGSLQYSFTQIALSFFPLPLIPLFFVFSLSQRRDAGGASSCFGLEANGGFGETESQELAQFLKFFFKHWDWTDLK